MRPTILLCAAALVATVATVALAQPMSPTPAAPPAAAGGPKGEAILQRACTSCHGADLTTSQRHSSDEWTDVVSRMIGNGAQLTDAEYSLLLDYLTVRYGPTGPNAPAH